MYDINPTLPLHGKLAEWGYFMASVISHYNFSLALGFSGWSEPGASLLPGFGMPPITSLPPSASLMLKVLGISLSFGGVRCLSVRKSGVRWA